MVMPYINSGKSKLYYEEYGEGPPLIMVHGVGGTMPVGSGKSQHFPSITGQWSSTSVLSEIPMMLRRSAEAVSLMTFFNCLTS